MSENPEEITKVELLDTNELHLVLGSGGDASYQHVYREARGVYWNNEVGAFRGTRLIKWTLAEWFAHIVATCGSIGISLRLANSVEWVGIPETDKQEIIALQAV